MARLVWNDREYAQGIDRGVFYPPSGIGEAWNGIISIEETPIDSDIKTRYIDGVKTHQRLTTGYFAGIIKSYGYPPSFFEDILAQRRPKTFGMSYRTLTRDQYKIHLVYNVLLAPSQYIHQQNVVESYSWGFTTLPLEVPEAKRSAHLIIETSIAYSWVLTELEDILYGTEGDVPHLPTPEEVVAIFEANAILRIVDHGDGTWSAIGPDSAIIMLDSETFQITWPSAVYINANTYRISSL